jgi:hypothetical protein
MKITKTQLKKTIKEEIETVGSGTNISVNKDELLALLYGLSELSNSDEWSTWAAENEKEDEVDRIWDVLNSLSARLNKLYGTM